jgi:phosphoglycolate phosphatase-like HAD superfamily hydrolase
MAARISVLATTLLILLGLLTRVAFAQGDPLPSWNDGAAKERIVAFVAEVTRYGSPGYVPPDQRIATFDNDGTLWCEQPLYVQLVYTIDRVKALVAEHPELREQEPLKSVLAGDPTALAASGETNVAGLLGSTHAGMPMIQYDATVSRWLETSRHPRFDRPYTRLVYQPMVELLTYLRANGFKTFIVSGGDVDFMRTFAEQVYGIPPDQVVGSANKKQYQLRGDLGVLIRSPEMAFVDDHEGKPVGIGTFIGCRPILAFGNSDGDQQMLE